MISEKIETFGFMSPESESSKLIKLEGLGRETRYRDYFFDNKDRNHCFLFQYTLSGKGKVNIDGEELYIGKNTGFFLKFPSNTSYGVTENCDEWSFLWLIISGKAADDIYKEITDKYGQIITLDENCSSISMLKYMFSLSKNKQINSGFFSQELAFSFLCRLNADLSEPKNNLSSLSQRAKKIIDSDFADLKGVGDIAEKLNVTQEHLSRTFSKETGTPLIDALLKKKLSYSLILLRDSELTLDEIANECGFSSGNYFGKVFKRYVGLSPKALKNDPLYGKYSDIVIF